MRPAPRRLVGLLALLVQGAASWQAGLAPCTMHGAALAQRVTSVAPDASPVTAHAAHGMSHAEHPGMAPVATGPATAQPDDDSAPDAPSRPGCDCAHACCATAPLPRPPHPVEARLLPLRAAHAPWPVVAAPASPRAHALPFATAPPALRNG
jgi:hypothetical protein